MFQRRSSRFAIEVVVLVALAVSAAVAHLNRLVIAGVMLVGWLVVTALEWASVRGEAHYGSGLPPRYYQPQVRLPPPRAMSEPIVRHAAPAALVEQPVWAPPGEEPAWPVAPIEQPAWPVAPVVEHMAVPVAPEEPAAAEVEALPVALEEPAAAEVEPLPVALEEPAAAEVEALPVAPDEPAVAEAEPVAFVPEVEEPAVVEAVAVPTIESQVELGTPIEFARAAEDGEPASGFSLGDEPALEVWPEEGETAPEFSLGDGPPLEVWPELPASWFEAPAPQTAPEGVAVELPVEVEPEPDLSSIELTPSAEELEPVAELEPELPAPLQANWFDAPLPGESLPQPAVEDLVDDWPELPAEEPAPEPYAPPVEEPVLEAWLPEPELEFPPLPELPTLPEPELAHWFDAQLPGSPELVDADAAGSRELPAWAYVDLDAEAEDELAAEEILPEELTPPVGATSDAASPPDFDAELPLGEPLPEEASTTSWFDDPGERAWEQEAVEAPDRAAGTTGSSFAPGPVTAHDLPQSELELDLLIGRLAGEPLGEERALMTWFDAQLPGVNVSEPAKPSEASAWPVRDEEEEVGGWETPAEESPVALSDVWDHDPPADDETAVEAFKAPEPDPTARHSIDPLAVSEGSGGRLWGRKHADGEEGDAPSVEVPARPAGRLLLPGRAKRDT